MLTKESIIGLKHIVADLENMDVLINSYHEELINQQEKNRYSLVMYFIEYSITRFRWFMENKKYFDETVVCNCYKCKSIGYSNVTENINHITQATKQLKDVLEDTKRRLITCSLNLDMVYLTRFINFCKYFSDEFVNITTENKIAF